MTVTQQIRAQYPHPRRFEITSSADAYCVGGAVCLYYATVPGVGAHFPQAGHLAYILQDVNEHLTACRAMEYADELITANDRSEFDKAWRIADQALTHGQ